MSDPVEHLLVQDRAVVARHERDTKKQRRYDQHGEIRLMAMANNYVMVRRPHCYPFVLSVKEWRRLPVERPTSKAGETR